VKAAIWVSAAISAMVVLSASASASDWPQFLGPNADGTSPITGINKNWKENPPSELWRVSMKDDGYAGPSVADGRLFIIDRDGDNDVVKAFKLDSGELLWQFSYSDGGGANYGYARSTPAVDGGKVYTLSRNGLLHCLNVEDGSKVWTRDIRADFKGRPPSWQYSYSPRIDGNVLIVQPGGQNAAVAVLNKTTGQTIWAGGGSDRPGYGAPVIATLSGRKQYVIFTGSGVMGVDAQNGNQLWRQEWRTPNDVNAATPLVMGQHVYITSGYGRGGAMLRVDRDKVEIVWENKEVQSHFSSPILYGGFIYATTDPGFLVCLKPETGESVWRQRGFEKGAIAIADGTIIALDGRRGEVVMAEATPESYNELGRFAGLGGQSWTAPIVADGKLIIRNKSALAVYNLQ